MRVVLLFVVALAACGPSAKQKTIATTLAATNAARDAFLLYDDTRQASIVDNATSLEEGKERLAAWREDRDEVVAAFETVYRAIAIAATDASDMNVAEMVALAASLREVYARVTGKDPP